MTTITFDTVKHVHYSSVTGPASNEYFAMKKAVEEWTNEFYTQANIVKLTRKIQESESRDEHANGGISEDKINIEAREKTDKSASFEISYESSCTYLVEVKALSAHCKTKTSTNWKQERSFKLDAEVPMCVTLHKLI